METESEEFVRILNSNVFLKEFSFSRATFHPIPGKELELADHLVCIDQLLIIFQVKERDPTSSHSTERNATWFRKKVIGRAKEQIKDTLRFLSNHPSSTIRNLRGHQIRFPQCGPENIIKVILYRPAQGSETIQLVKHYVSREAGFIHVLTLSNYARICALFVTPTEIEEYLRFREVMCLKFKEAISVSEEALLGQYLEGNPNVKPGEEFVRVLNSLEDRDTEFDISWLFTNFAERMVRYKDSEDPLDYYKILAETAKLARTELKAFKERIKYCVEAVNKDQERLATRFICPRTGCGFVFVPVRAVNKERRLIGLQNFAWVAKYDSRLTKQVGVSFARDGKQMLIDWVFIEGPWEHDSELDEVLKTQPFRPLKDTVAYRYQIRNER